MEGVYMNFKKTVLFGLIAGLVLSNGVVKPVSPDTPFSQRLINNVVKIGVPAGLVFGSVASMIMHKEAPKTALWYGFHAGAIVAGALWACAPLAVKFTGKVREKLNQGGQFMALRFVMWQKAQKNTAPVIGSPQNFEQNTEKAIEEMSKECEQKKKEEEKK